jgi:hypothetical protein
MIARVDWTDRTGRLRQSVWYSPDGLDYARAYAEHIDGLSSPSGRPRVLVASDSDVDRWEVVK